MRDANELAPRSYIWRHGAAALAWFLTGAAVLGGGTSYIYRRYKPDYARAAASVRWPIVSGVVIQSVVHGRGDGAPVPDIRYEYATPNGKFVGHLLWMPFGDTVAPSGRFSTRPSDASRSTGARDVVARYPVGTQVRVAYDPADPGFAVLETGVTIESYIVWLAMAAVLGAGALCWVIAWLVIKSMRAREGLGEDTPEARWRRYQALMKDR